MAKTAKMNANQKSETVMRFVEKLYEQEPNWLEFYREVYGVDGILQAVYASTKEFLEFEASEAHARIEQMLVTLRGNRGPKITNDPTKIITVRIPQSLHTEMLGEAKAHDISLNKLCITKLLKKLETP